MADRHRVAPRTNSGTSPAAGQPHLVRLQERDDLPVAERRGDLLCGMGGHITVKSASSRGGSSAGRASRSQCEGRGFDPLPLHQLFLFLVSVRDLTRPAPRGPAYRRHRKLHRLLALRCSGWSTSSIRSEGRYRMLFERARCRCGCSTPRSLRYLAVNDAAVRLYGYSARRVPRHDGRGPPPAGRGRGVPRVPAARVGRGAARPVPPPQEERRADRRRQRRPPGALARARARAWCRSTTSPSAQRSQTRLRALSRRLLEVQEDERRGWRATCTTTSARRSPR